MKKTITRPTCQLRITYYVLITALVLLTTYYLLPTAHAARLYFYPQNVNVAEGDSYIVEVRIDTEGELINALEIGGSVSNGSIKSISTDNSLIQIFISSSHTDNSFRFTGGTPGGFTGDGIIGRLTIRASQSGETLVAFDENPNLLSGIGQNISAPINFINASANITARSQNHIDISSRSHPDQNTWYNETNLHLRWNLEDGIEYSYLVSLDPTAVPDNTPDKPTGKLQWQGDISIEGLSQGIYYFTLKRVEESDIFRYRAMIDTIPPSWIAVELSEGVQETGGQSFVTFIAKDDLSGISHYEVRVDKNAAQDAIAPYILPDHYGKITLTAYDNAGNSIDETIISEGERRVFGIYIVVLLIIIGGAVVGIKPIRERIFAEKTNKNKE